MTVATGKWVGGARECSVIVYVYFNSLLNDLSLRSECFYRVCHVSVCMFLSTVFCFLCNSLTRGSPTCLTECFPPTPPRSKCTTPAPSRSSRVNNVNTSGILEIDVMASNFCLISILFRCAVWIQWNYLRIRTNRLRENSHHGGTEATSLKSNRFLDLHSCEPQTTHKINTITPQRRDFGAFSIKPFPIN